MLGAKVAGSPWSNASNDAPTAEATDVVKSAGCLMQKTTSYWKKWEETMGETSWIKQNPWFRDMWRRESNPGLLSEGRDAARQKC